MHIRNQVTSKLRKETTDYNNNRIDLAEDENEVWKIAKDIFIIILLYYYYYKLKFVFSPLNISLKCSPVHQKNFLEDREM